MSKLTLKKYLIMIAFWAIGIIAIIATSIYMKYREGVEYGQVAVPYIEQTLPEISKWDPVKTKALMAPEIAATIPEDKFARAMEFFSQLGALQSMEAPAFNKAFVDQETDIGIQTIIEYDVKAHYENGDAEVNLKLLQKGEAYQLYSFNFRAEKLTPQEAQ